MQHARYKYSLNESMRSVLNDVYVKSRSLSYEQREIISACIESELKWQKTSTTDVPAFYLAYNTKTIQHSISCDRIQVESALLLLFTYLVAKETDVLTKLDELLFSKIPVSDAFRKQFDLSELDLHNLLTYSVMNYYDRASASDVADRHSWVTEVVNHYAGKLNTSNLSSVKSISECLKEAVIANAGTMKNWPWDGRRLSNAVSKMPIDRANCDKLALTMSYELTKYRCFRLDCVGRRDKDDMDVNLSEYSLACISGKHV